MNRHQVNGAVRNLTGRVQTSVGGATGNSRRQLRGATNQVTGGAEYLYGGAVAAADDMLDNLGHQASRHSQHLQDAGEILLERGKDYGRMARSYASDHRPLLLVGAAVTVLVAGWFLSRQRSY